MRHSFFISLALLLLASAAPGQTTTVCLRAVDPDGELLDQYLAAVYTTPGVQVVSQAFAVDTAVVCLPLGSNTEQRLSVLKAGYVKVDVEIMQLDISDGVATITLVRDADNPGNELDEPLNLSGERVTSTDPTESPSDTITLPEASLRVKRRARLVNNNDSTRYLASELRDSTDRTVADLLAKVPGMQLGKDGYLSYRGSKVSRVLVDGNDVFGTSGYAEPIQRLGSGLVAEITAIERFHEDAVLAMIEPSDETVIDLTSAESYRGRFAGDAPLAAGVAANGDPRYQVGLAGTYFTKGRSLYVDGNAERLDRLVGGGGGMFRFGGSPEPIGTLPRELPSLRPARVSVGTAQAPAALVGDAALRQASVNYHVRLPTGNRLVARVSHAGAADALDGTTRLRARGTEGVDLEYDLSEDRESRARSSAWTADLQYDATSADRRRTWRLVGLARQARNRFSDRLGLRDALEPTPEVDFPVRSAGQRSIGTLGARLNQRLGSSAALQVFAEGGAAALREDARLRVAGGFPLDGAQTLVANDSVAQTTNVGYAYLRSGAKTFVRLGAALLDARLVAALHRYDARTELGRVDSTRGRFGAQPTYRTAELSAGASLAFSPRWRGRIAFGAEAIQGPFAPVGASAFTDAAVAVASYDFSAERVVGKRPSLAVAARRQVALPSPASRLGVPLLNSPLSLSRELPVATAQVQELILAQWRRSHPGGKGNAAAELTYVWRQRELSEVYRLNGPAREVQTGRLLNGSSVSFSGSGDRQMLKWRSVLEWRAGGARQRQDANVAGATGRFTRTELSGELRYYWLRSARVLPRVEVRAGYSEVGGALRARNGFVAGDLGARIRVGRLSVTPSVTLEHILVERTWTRAYLSGGLELAYPVGRRQDNFPANLTLSVRNAFGEGTVRTSRFNAPFLFVSETVAVPMSVWIGYRVPIETEARGTR